MRGRVFALRVGNSKGTAVGPQCGMPVHENVQMCEHAFRSAGHTDLIASPPLCYMTAIAYTT